MSALSKPISVLFSLFLSAGIFAQQVIDVKADYSKNTVSIEINGQPFTRFIYPDSLEKPVLFPIYAADGAIVTRGYPLQPRPNEPTDHPHHIGLWLNYESVNGLDFWNNSSAIAADKKHLYGWIKTTAITETKSGDTGRLSYDANWQDINKNVLLKEKTTFRFSAQNNLRIIDRITTLTAQTDVTMPDIKDGLLGLRVAHELELPSKEQRSFTNNKGNVTTVDGSGDKTVTGNYLTSRNIKADAAWATRAEWCMLYGKIGADSISIVIIDHPANSGYPTYWHARGYGLFAANPLGQKIFSGGKEILNFSLATGASVTFRYRIIVYSGNSTPDAKMIGRLAESFAHDVF